MAAINQQKIVIVGAGIAGVSAAEAVRKQSLDAEIVLISNESHLPYYRLNLTRYMAGEINSEALNLHPEEWYGNNSINLIRDVEVKSIDLERKNAILSNGNTERYDKLIIATGSHAFIPPIPGVDLKNVFAIRTRDDADKVLDACKKGKRCVCVGGGLLGLEIAGALKIHDVDITVLEGFDWLLPRQLDQEAASILQKYIKNLGIDIKTGAAPRELRGEKEVTEIMLADGSSIPADVVVFATGIRSNNQLAQKAGLTIDKAIVVDDSMSTSHRDVFAAGESTEHHGITYGIWAPCHQQGTVAGIRAAGGKMEFQDIPAKYALKVLGYKLFSIGTISASNGSYHVIKDTIDGNYYSFLFHEDTMVGAILMEDTALSSTIKAIVERKLDCSEMLSKNSTVSDIIESLRNWKFS